MKTTTQRMLLRDSGSCIRLNGANSLISNAMTNGLPLYTTSSGSYTISAWVNPRTIVAGGNAIYSESNNAATNQVVVMWLLLDSYPKVSIFIRNNAGVALLNIVKGTNQIPLRQWSNITFTDNAGICHLYINGVEDAASALGAFNYTPSGIFSLNRSTIGALVRTSTANYFDGLIDDVLLYQAALTQVEVQQLYWYGLYRLSIQPSVGWTYNENTGNTSEDISGNGNTATLTNIGWASDSYAKNRQVSSGRNTAQNRAVVV